ncbi:hypothetical protein OG225_30165 [Nocardia sp. NBC_01377]|uniref:hypothetical protein n=1 Tax=Nocardia sp. NBC_01377 TaxID=2903595 RepID=UPI00324BB623
MDLHESAAHIDRPWTGSHNSGGEHPTIRVDGEKYAFRRVFAYETHNRTGKDRGRSGPGLPPLRQQDGEGREIFQRCRPLGHRDQLGEELVEIRGGQESP